MPDELIDDIHKLHRYATGLQSLVEDLHSRLPQHVEGRDPTGSVRVVLGPDGLPASFQVDYDWKRNLRPAAFGDAVRQAVRAAANQRLSAWTRAFNDADLPAQSERLQESVDSTSAGPQQPAPQQPAPQSAPSQSVSARTNAAPPDAGKLIRDFLDATADLDGFANPTVAQGTGVTAYGKCSLTLTAGGEVACTADPSWVSDKSGDELTEALHIVLAAARPDLAEAAARTDPAARVSRVLDETLALLRDPGYGGPR